MQLKKYEDFNDFQKLYQLDVEIDYISSCNNYIWLAAFGGVRGNELTKTLNYHPEICFLTEERALPVFYHLLRREMYYLKLPGNNVDLSFCGYRQNMEDGSKIVKSSDLMKYWDLYVHLNKQDKNFFGVKYPETILNYNILQKMMPNAKFCFIEDKISISVEKWLNVLEYDNLADEVIRVALLAIGHNTLCKKNGLKNLNVDKIKDRETFDIIFTEIFKWLNIKNLFLDLLWEKTEDIWTVTCSEDRVLSVLDEIKIKNIDVYNILIKDIRYNEEYIYQYL